jgi:hypothetical protein
MAYCKSHRTETLMNAIQKTYRWPHSAALHTCSTATIPGIATARTPPRPKNFKCRAHAPEKRLALEIFWARQCARPPRAPRASVAALEFGVAQAGEIPDDGDEQNGDERKRGKIPFSAMLPFCLEKSARRLILALRGAPFALLASLG